MACNVNAQTETAAPKRTTAGYSFPHWPTSKMSNPPINCVSEHVGYTCIGDTILVFMPGAGVQRFGEWPKMVGWAVPARTITRVIIVYSDGTTEIKEP